MYLSEEVKPYSEEGSKRTQVEKMFNHIAPTYDRLNHTLSLGIDRRWRKNAIKHLGRICKEPLNSVLDIATGTGDFALLAEKILHPRHITGIDISEGMMNVGREKVAQAGLDGTIGFKQEDCSQLSFADDSFDAVISSFGLRNFENLDACLAEMYRVTQKGGHLVAIDLSTPKSFPMKHLFWVYKKLVMPFVGRSISHDDSAYTYLPDSMDAIPQGKEMVEIFSKAGWKNVRYKRLLPGMCIRYTAEK